MSAEFSIRQVNAPAFRDAAIPAAARASTPTDLPAAQSVTAAEETAAASNNERDRAENLARQTSYDRAAASLVFRVVDQRSNQVVRQIPEEQTLKMRSYRRALDGLIAEQIARRRINREV
jgi:uncharacterized iron-regulated membrane protein